MSDMEWTTSWDSVLYYENQLLPNHYTLVIHFDIATDDAEEQSIAFDRIKFFIDTADKFEIFRFVYRPAHERQIGGRCKISRAKAIWISP